MSFRERRGTKTQAELSPGLHDALHAYAVRAIHLEGLGQRKALLPVAQTSLVQDERRTHGAALHRVASANEKLLPTLAAWFT